MQLPWTVPGEDRDPPFSVDALLTDVMLYWLGRANPASWYYLSLYGGHLRQLPEGRRVEVPTGFLLTPRDTTLFPPNSVLERAYNVVHRRDSTDGGHFVAFEQPTLYLDEVRAFFRPFRRPPEPGEKSRDAPAQGHAPRSSYSGAGDLVDRGEAIEGAGVADEGKQHGEHLQQHGAVVADVEVACDVALHLGVGSAEGDE
jgi:hypothetical protein